MKLNNLLKILNILEDIATPNQEITGLAYHSAHVKPGNLFVCIRGYKTDGHLYLRQACQNGAIAAVVEAFNHEVPIGQYRVADSRVALAALADHFYHHPSQKFKLTGITATNGKTTTTYMTNAIFEKAGLTTGMIGTVIIKCGSIVRPAELTTPESLDLQRYFQDMVDEQVSHAVMEVSSSGLELKRVASVDFDTVVINNISREHIDLHGSFDAYFNAKASLVRQAGPEQWAIFNLDCPYTASLVNQTAARTFTYGLKNRNADILVNKLDLSTGRATFTVEIKKAKTGLPVKNLPREFTVQLSVLGLHSVYNAMAAVMVGLLHEIPVSTIQEALQGFRGVERRFELIFEDNFKVIDDHFANSGNIHVTLETLQLMEYNRLHMVYAIRGSRGVTVNRENAEAIAHWAPILGLDKVIATTSIDHVGEKDLVTTAEKNIYAEVMNKAGIKTDIYARLPEAIDAALSEVKEGDIILLAGCQGMDYGASVCLDLIHRRRPDLPRAKVFAALKNRVAGIT